MKLFIFFSLFIVLILTSCASYKEPQIKHQSNNIMISKKIYVDSNFNALEVELIKEAAKNWENFTNKIIKYDLVFGFDLKDFEPETVYKYTNKIIIIKSSKNDKVVELIEDEINKNYDAIDEDDKIRILGYTFKKETFEGIFIVYDRMMIKDKLYSKKFLNVIMHELGHELNMRHFDEAPSIMNSSYERFIEIITNSNKEVINCLTKYDAMQFCSLYLCDDRKIKTCN